MKPRPRVAADTETFTVWMGGQPRCYKVIKEVLKFMSTAWSQGACNKKSQPHHSLLEQGKLSSYGVRGLTITACTFETDLLSGGKGTMTLLLCMNTFDLGQAFTVCISC